MAKNILIIGAGRSSANLISYLINHAEREDWHLRVGDMDAAFAREKIAGHPRGSAFKLDASDAKQRRDEISKADLVISMLPASMHMLVTRDCIEFGKNVITPSYIPDEMWALDEEAKKKGIVILNEMGLDPGIDHMSAMQIIHHLQAKGAAIESFESYTGGLIAPESDNNPWHYKITWNPRNVVLAGYGGTARYRENGDLKFVPYHKLFERTTSIDVEGYGSFDGYANRDSLKYLKLYGLENIPTLVRGTLRKSGYCQAWNGLVQAGLTDDSFQVDFPEDITWKKLTASFLDGGTREIETSFQKYTGVSDASMDKLRWLGIFSDEKIKTRHGSPASALQSLIEEKWKLGEDDKDMIVMIHRFTYVQENQRRQLISSLVCIGDDPVHTGMSKTVGLPIGIAARQILKGTWKLTGVHLPVSADIYEPVLNELKDYGIIFQEKILD